MGQRISISHGPEDSIFTSLNRAGAPECEYDSAASCIAAETSYPGFGSRPWIMLGRCTLLMILL